MLKHRFRGLLLEVHEWEQAGTKSLRTEDQFIFFSIEAQLKSCIPQGRFEGAAAFLNQFLAALVHFVGIHDLPQLRLNLSKGCPRFLRPFPEVLFKPGQGQTAAAIVYVLLGISVSGAGFQGLFKVTQGGAFLIQVIVSGSDPVIPAVIACKILLMGSQKLQSLFIQHPSCLSDFCRANIRLGQLAVQLWGTLPGGDGLQSIHHLLNFILFKPLPALFQ